MQLSKIASSQQSDKLQHAVCDPIDEANKHHWKWIMWCTRWWQWWHHACGKLKISWNWLTYFPAYNLFLITAFLLLYNQVLSLDPQTTLKRGFTFSRLEEKQCEFFSGVYCYCLWLLHLEMSSVICHWAGENDSFQMRSLYCETGGTDWFGYGIKAAVF